MDKYKERALMYRPPSATGADLPCLGRHNQTLQERQSMLLPLLWTEHVHRHHCPVEGALNLSAKHENHEWLFTAILPYVFS